MLKDLRKNLSLPMLMSRGFAWVENRAKELDTVLYPNRHSKPRLPVGSSTPAERHPDWQPFTDKQKKTQRHYMLRNFKSAWKSFRYLRTPQARLPYSPRLRV
ncbi:MAG: hypothetical protein AAFR81_23740 [Chloroflexota bacterium]